MTRLALPLLVVAMTAGCEDTGPPDPATASGPAAPARPAHTWREAGAVPRVAVVGEAGDAALQAAIAQARATMDDARERWRRADADDRAAWAVKWAAPTADDRVEHVWVVPLAWSRFRIEGYLGNEPDAPLLGGHVEGDLVSFPAAELSDWLVVTDAGREGGFTVDVLEGRHGVPE